MAKNDTNNLSADEHKRRREAARDRKRRTAHAKTAGNRRQVTDTGITEGKALIAKLNRSLFTTLRNLRGGALPRLAAQMYIGKVLGDSYELAQDHHFESWFNNQLKGGKSKTLVAAGFDARAMTEHELNELDSLMIALQDRFMALCQEWRVPSDLLPAQQTHWFLTYSQAPRKVQAKPVVTTPKVVKAPVNSKPKTTHTKPTPKVDEVKVEVTTDPSDTRSPMEQVKDSMATAIQDVAECDGWTDEARQKVTVFADRMYAGLLEHPRAISPKVTEFLNSMPEYFVELCRRYSAPNGTFDAMREDWFVSLLPKGFIFPQPATQAEQKKQRPTGQQKKPRMSGNKARRLREEGLQTAAA